jgi:hypothetical protein
METMFARRPSTRFRESETPYAWLPRERDDRVHCALDTSSAVERFAHASGLAKLL